MEESDEWKSCPTLISFRHFLCLGYVHYLAVGVFVLDIAVITHGLLDIVLTVLLLLNLLLLLLLLNHGLLNLCLC